jgi:hypothetical protein
MPITTATTTYGYRAVFADPVSVCDIATWVDDVRAAVQGRESFGQLVDLRQRTLTGRDPAVQEATRDAMMSIRGWGLVRSASVVADELVAQRLRRWSAMTGLESCERFIDGRLDDWEKAALAWIVDGVEPWATVGARYFRPHGIVDWPLGS